MPMISKRKRNKERNHGDDLLSQLPDHLISQILSKLTTKDSVKTSVLATRWRYFWKHVPGLDFSYTDFENHDLEGFVDRFLGFDKNSVICRFKIDCDAISIDASCFKKWVNIVVTRGLQYLATDGLSFDRIEMPVSIFMCESLVHLKLRDVKLLLEGFDSISLPRLETIHLDTVMFSSVAAFERLISSSPVLQSLEIVRIQNVEVLRVRSQSLSSLSISSCYCVFNKAGGKFLLVIDAPRLKDLYLSQDEFETLALISVGASMNVNIEGLFVKEGNLYLDDITKLEAVRNFLVGISKVVTDLKISSAPVEVIDAYSRIEQLPQFPNLTSLHASLPTFLERAPNLKSLYLTRACSDIERVTRSPVPKCMLTSLVRVHITISMENYTYEIELVKYILGNAAILRTLFLFLGGSTKEDKRQVLQQLLLFPRCSSGCRVFLL